MSTVFYDPTSFNQVAALDSTRFVCTYGQDDDNDHPQAVVGTISGEDITFGAPIEVQANWGDVQALVALDSSRAVLVWQRRQATIGLKACVLTVSSANVTAGPIVDMDLGTDHDYVCAAALNSASVVVCYEDGGVSDYGTAQALVVSGTDITVGAKCVFSSAATTYVSVAALSSATAGVAFSDAGSGKACLLTVSGMDMTAGAVATWYTKVSYNIAHLSVAGVDGKLAVAAKAASNKGHVYIGVPSGTALSFGSAQTFLDATNLAFTRLADLGYGRLALAYGRTATDGRSMSCGVSGTSVSFGASSAWLAGTPPIHAHTCLTATGNGEAVLSYADNSTDAGTAAVLLFEGPTTTTVPTTTVPPTTTTVPPTTIPTTVPPTTVPPTTTTVPPTTTTVPPTTTTVPTTTVPPTTTTVPPTTVPPTTTIPPTTTAPAMPHPADTGPGVPNWRCEPPEVLAYAADWLGGATPEFQGVPLDGLGVAQAYILRAADIALAHYEARYEDVGSEGEINSATHPQRWREMPDA